MEKQSFLRVPKSSTSERMVRRAGQWGWGSSGHTEGAAVSRRAREQDAWEWRREQRSFGGFARTAVSPRGFLLTLCSDRHAHGLLCLLKMPDVVKALCTHLQAHAQVHTRTYTHVHTHRSTRICT